MHRSTLLIIPLSLIILGSVWYVWLGRASNDASALDGYNAGAAALTGASPSGGQSSATLIINNNDTTPMQATLHTNQGDITFEFDPTLSPTAVENFVKLAQSGFYNDTKFHRVIKGFMIQGGDPLSKDDTKKAYWGTGGPGYQFPDEITPDSHNTVGTVAMANSGRPGTNGSQFYINAANNSFLDGKYVVFGHVISGMDVVTAINNMPTDDGDRPLEPVIVSSVEIK